MKFINCKKSVKIPTENGKFVKFPAHFVGICPDEIFKHWYFKALCKDGTITFLDDSKDSTSEETAKIAAEKEAKIAEQAERRRRIDEAKEAAKIAAEKEADEKGMTAPDKKKLVSERIKEAVQIVTDSFNRLGGTAYKE
ncbi:MAG: hypothetical protein FWF82_07835 [Oscillospiraceae bacterium]|nr:hypothetical protein [Oscillospiraceae bacterium]